MALLLVAAAAWEWARLNQLPGAAALATAALCVALCAAAWGAGWLGQRLTPLWALAAVLWVAVVTLLLRRGPQGWSTLPLAWRWAGGVLALWLTWLAVAQARVLGINVLLSVLTLVWAADIAAYFAGRAFGLRFTRTRLAPSISPGKSWEGVWSGMFGVLLLAVVWMAFDRHAGPAVPSLYTRLFEALGGAGLVVAVIFLAALSVVGDLFESLVKRSAGAKDSSGLLPGHGGVLDRVDSVTAALPVLVLGLALLEVLD